MDLTNIDVPHIRFNKWAAWGQNYPSLNSWEEWAKSPYDEPNLSLDENSSASPSVAFLPINFRKKLSLFTKISLHLANQILDGSDNKNIEIIHCSRHGEAETTVELLESISANEASSPMAFSRSVLNAAMGIHSITTQNTQTNLALAAFKNTFVAGLLEASIRAYSTNKPVLLIYADNQCPVYFRSFVNEPQSAFGLAFILENSLTNDFPERELLNNPFRLLKSVILKRTSPESVLLKNS